MINDGQPRHLDAKVWIHGSLTAFVVFLWARVAWPDDLFSASPIFAGMKEFAPEWVWSILLGIAALIGIYGMLTRWRVTRFLCTALLLSAHLTIAGFLLSSGGTILPAALILLAAQGGFLLFRRWRDGF